MRGATLRHVKTYSDSSDGAARYKKYTYRVHHPDGTRDKAVHLFDLKKSTVTTRIPNGKGGHTEVKTEDYHGSKRPTTIQHFHLNGQPDGKALSGDWRDHGEHVDKLLKDGEI